MGDVRMNRKKETPRLSWTSVIQRLAQSDRRHGGCERSHLLRGDVRKHDYRRWFNAEPVRDVPWLSWAAALARLARSDALEPGPPNDGRIACPMHRRHYLHHYHARPGPTPGPPPTPRAPRPERRR